MIINYTLLSELHTLPQCLRTVHTEKNQNTSELLKNYLISKESQRNLNQRNLNAAPRGKEAALRVAWRQRASPQGPGGRLPGALQRQGAAGHVGWQAP